MFFMFLLIPMRRRSAHGNHYVCMYVSIYPIIPSIIVSVVVRAHGRKWMTTPASMTGCCGPFTWAVLMTWSSSWPRHRVSSSGACMCWRSSPSCLETRLDHLLLLMCTETRSNLFSKPIFSPFRLQKPWSVLVRPDQWKRSTKTLRSWRLWSKENRPRSVSALYNEEPGKTLAFDV